MNLTSRAGRRLAAGIALASSAILLPAAALAASAAAGSPGHPAQLSCPWPAPSGASGFFPDSAASRATFTHLPRVISWTPMLRATSATGRPPSMTKATDCSLYSGAGAMFIGDEVLLRWCPAGWRRSRRSPARALTRPAAGHRLRSAGTSETSRSQEAPLRHGGAYRHPYSTIPIGIVLNGFTYALGVSIKPWLGDRKPWYRSSPW